MTKAQTLGKFSEDRAAEYLLSLGWIIIARNVKIFHGELDIVAIDTKITPEELVVVEVRSRTIGKIQSPIDSVGARKLNSLIKSSREFIDEIEWQKFWRIDLIGITLKNKDDFQNWDLIHLKDITSGMNVLS